MPGMVCPRCGSDAPPGARFCPSCGGELGAPGGREERKLVSVLFIDMVGSTARADGADPEDVRALNRLYLHELRDRIEGFGGVVEKFIGDAVMAVFGAPLARDGDAERAVRAALGSLEGVEELNRRHPDLDLRVRAAVCTGEALVTLDAGPVEPLATGDIVNTAARLQSVAPPGRVIVGEGTHRFTKDVFTFEPMEPIEAKGKRDPVGAWLVGEAVLQPAFRRPSSTPLVGRRRELQAIREAWERVAATHQPHLITVLGPPGIGKTRLVREATDELEPGGARVLWGRSLPYAEQTPYRAVSEIIGRAAGIFEDDPPADARSKLEGLVAGLLSGGEAPEATRYLSLLMGLGLDEPTDDPVHLQYATRRLVEELAARDPLVLVFEDVYWADDPLLDLIEYLVTYVQAPAMFVGLARPELLQRRSTWGADVRAGTTLSLDPLTVDEATEMVSGLIALDGRTAIDRVVQTAEGNPLFLEELIAASDPDPEVLPPTIRAATVARIDALPADARATLLHAAVMGQTFWRGVVASLDGIDDVDVALDALTATGLVRRQARSRVHGDVEYAFKHVLVRDAAYEMLPRATRRALHAAVAAEIERRVDDPDEVAWILAHHLREAGEQERAVGYYLLAAERARDAMATDETWDLYTQALELVGSDEERRAIRLDRGVALVDLWETGRGVAELTELLPTLRGAQRVEALIACGRAMAGTENTDEMFVWARQAVELASAEAPELEGRALAVLATAHSMRGDAGDLARAAEIGDRAHARWQAGARPYELSEHYHMHIAVNYWMGSYERGLELAREGSEIHGLGPQSAEYVIGSFGQIGLNLAGLGRYEEAIARGEEAIATAHRLGAWDIRVTNDSTSPLRDVYALDEARRRSEGMVERLGPSDFNMPWMNARADLICAQLLADDFDVVERTWPAAWEDAVASHAWEHWLITGRLAVVRAQLELELGRLDESVTWSERALELARPVGRRKYEVVSMIELGRALTAKGLFTEGAARLHEAVSLADALGSPLYRWQACAALADGVRGVRDEAASADRHLQEAVTIIHEIAGSLAPERAAGYLAAREVAEVLERAG
jgi:class 3 adenylate cyclase/tetratricopeptide (TPR) repeat protein